MVRVRTTVKTIGPVQREPFEFHRLKGNLARNSNCILKNRDHNKHSSLKNGICFCFMYPVSSGEFSWNLYVRNPFKISSKDRFFD